MKVVLVTGASGFVGRHVVAELAKRGFTVHAMGRHAQASVDVIWHKADLFDSHEQRNVIEKIQPTHLLHLAWETRHGYFWEAPENLDWVGATLNLVRIFKDSGGHRAVFVGSCAEYDWTSLSLRQGRCREEETAYHPITLYALAKIVTHQLIAAYAARTGLSYAWGRLFFLYGPFEAETRFVPSVINALLKKQRIALGDDNVTRDFLDVRDAGGALAALLDSSFEGKINIASGNAVTVGDVAQRLAQLIGEEGLLAFGTRTPEKNSPVRLVGDISRLREKVGFTPLRDLNAGLENAVTWWRQKKIDACQDSLGT